MLSSVVASLPFSQRQVAASTLMPVPTSVVCLAATGLPSLVSTENVGKHVSSHASSTGDWKENTLSGPINAYKILYKQSFLLSTDLHTLHIQDPITPLRHNPSVWNAEDLHG